MKLPSKASRRQLLLPLERQAKQQPMEATRGELVKALADLLLEALGKEMEPTRESGGGNES
jgi:hypothetical protein